MKLRYVTLTGADDGTSIDGMIELGKKYSFVEFGILFSQSKYGVSRYPSSEWVETLCQKYPFNLSAHLCGKWVDDAIELGKLTNSDVKENFKRVQFNLAGGRLAKVLLNKECLLWKMGKDFIVMPLFPDVIFGGPFEKTNDFDLFSLNHKFPLLDSSGGRGIVSEKWPEIPCCHGEPIFCGYAGGIGPDNIKEELQKIEEVVGDNEIWIDMETKLRNNKDEFDLDKCEQVLSVAKEWSI